jgi:hypothetical protein
MLLRRSHGFVSPCGTESLVVTAILRSGEGHHGLNLSVLIPLELSFVYCLLNVYV